MTTPSDNRFQWVSSTGVPLGYGIAATDGVTYYAEIPAFQVSNRSVFAVTLVWNGQETASYTLESTNVYTLNAYDAVGTGWVSQAVALGQIDAGAAALQATGTVTFSRPGAAAGAGAIPAGKVVATVGGVQFATNAITNFGALDLSVDAAVTAVLPGTAGNVVANAITIITAPPVFDPTIGVTNAVATSGGVGGTADDGEWQIVYAQSIRWRVKRAVVVGGVSTATYAVKDN